MHWSPNRVSQGALWLRSRNYIKKHRPSQVHLQATPLLRRPPILACVIAWWTQSVVRNFQLSRFRSPRWPKIAIQLYCLKASPLRRCIGLSTYTRYTEVVVGLPSVVVSCDSVVVGHDVVAASKTKQLPVVSFTCLKSSLCRTCLPAILHTTDWNA